MATELQQLRKIADRRLRDLGTLTEQWGKLRIAIERVWGFVHKAYIEDAFVCPVCGGTDGDHNEDIIPRCCELEQRSAAKTVDRSKTILEDDCNYHDLEAPELEPSRHSINCMCVDCFHWRGSYKDKLPSLLHLEDCDCEICSR